MNSPKGVLVTGGSRGIGRATAKAFAARGYRVAVHYATRRDDAETTLRELTGSGHTCLPGDLDDPVVARQVAADAVAALGRLDVLVNNAALAPTEATRHAVAEVGYDDWVAAWRRAMDVAEPAKSRPGFERYVPLPRKPSGRDCGRIGNERHSNLLGAANVTWAVARHLIEAGRPGSIVNVGSRGAFRGEPEHPAYGASKAVFGLRLVS